MKKLIGTSFCFAYWCGKCGIESFLCVVIVGLKVERVVVNLSHGLWKEKRSKDFMKMCCFFGFMVRLDKAK